MAERKRFLQIGPESTYDTLVAATIQIEIESEDIRVENELEEIGTIGTYSTRRVERLRKVTRGSFTGFCNYQTVGNLLYYLVGDVDVTGAGPYTHTIPGSTGYADRPSLSIEVARDSDTLTWKYSGCILTGLTFEFTTDQVVRVTGEIIGSGTEATGAGASLSANDLDFALPTEVTLTMNASAVECRSISLAITRPADEPNELGSAVFTKQPQDNGLVSVAYTVEAFFDDLTEYNLSANQTDVDVAIAATDGTHSVTFNVDNSRIRQATPALNARDRLMGTYEGLGYFNTDATENMQAVVVNDVADVTV